MDTVWKQVGLIEFGKTNKLKTKLLQFKILGITENR